LLFQEVDAKYSQWDNDDGDDGLKGY
jgi:hypothetical protein